MTATPTETTAAATTVAVLPIDRELCIAEAIGWRERMLQALPAGPGATFRLDLGETSDCDGAGVQLLLAAAHECQLRDGRLELHAPSAPVRAAIERAGLGPVLGPLITTPEETSP